MAPIALLACALTGAACGDRAPARVQARAVAFSPPDFDDRAPSATTTTTPPPEAVVTTVPRRVLVAAPVGPSSLTDEGLRRLIACESGGRYGIRNGSYSGAAQWTAQTWGNQHTGYPSAADAPPEVQDAATRRLWGPHGEGAGNWPVCRHRAA